MTAGGGGGSEAWGPAWTDVLPDMDTEGTARKPVPPSVTPQGTRDGSLS